MVTRGGSLLDVELLTESLPQPRNKLWTSICGDGRWYTEQGDPVEQESRPDLFSGDIFEGNDGWKSGRPIYHRE